MVTERFLKDKIKEFCTRCVRTLNQITIHVRHHSKKMYDRVYVLKLLNQLERDREILNLGPGAGYYYADSRPSCSRREK